MPGPRLSSTPGERFGAEQCVDHSHLARYTVQEVLITDGKLREAAKTEPDDDKAARRTELGRALQPDSGRSSPSDAGGQGKYKGRAQKKQFLSLLQWHTDTEQG